MTTSLDVPVVPGLFELADDGQPVLVGTRCTACETHYFPASLGCRNPRCEHHAVQRAQFGRRGTLYSFTVQRYRPPALFRVDDWEPYALGLVDLDEGVRVLAHLDHQAMDELRIGMPMKLVLATLFRDMEGHANTVYKYQPLTDEVL